MENADHAGQPGQPDEAELVDVVVILNVSTPQQVRDALDGLRSVGLKVVKVDEENGMIEGVVDPKDLAALKALPTVKFARSRFAYIAEPPEPEDDDLQPEELQ